MRVAALALCALTIGLSGPGAAALWTHGGHATLEQGALHDYEVERGNLAHHPTDGQPTGGNHCDDDVGAFSSHLTPQDSSGAQRSDTLFASNLGAPPPRAPSPPEEQRGCLLHAGSSPHAHGNLAPPHRPPISPL